MVVFTLLLQPTMHGDIDPAVLAALPPSVQLDLLVQVSVYKYLIMPSRCISFSLFDILFTLKVFINVLYRFERD